jgi:hypothetical protein
MSSRKLRTDSYLPKYLIGDECQQEVKCASDNRFRHEARCATKSGEPTTLPKKMGEPGGTSIHYLKDSQEKNQTSQFS